MFQHFSTFWCLTSGADIVAINKWRLYTNTKFPWHQGTPIYWAQLPTGTRVRHFFYKRQRGQLARTPNAKDQKDPYLRVASARSNAPSDHAIRLSIDRLAALRIGGINQAFAFIRTSNWSTHRALIASVATQTPEVRFRSSLRFPNAGNIPPAKDNGVILLGSLGFLDQANEWYYEESTSRLYYWAPGNKAPDPTQSELVQETKVPNNIAFDGGNKLALTIENVEAHMAPFDCIRIINTTNINMTKVKALRCGNIGVRITAINARGAPKPTQSATLHQVSAQYIPGSGLRLSHIKQLNIVGDETSTTVSHIGAYTNQHSTSMAGIFVDNIDTLLIEKMIIKEVGSNAIIPGDPEVAGGTLMVRQNQISRYCTMLNDCGAIHVNGYKGIVKDAQKKQIINNTINDGVGEVHGYGPSKRVIASAIYLDWSASHFTVTGNRIADSRSETGGIYLHGGNHNLIHCNMVQAGLGPAFVLRRLAQCKTRPIIDNRVFYNYLEGKNGFDTSFRTESLTESTTIRNKVLSNKNFGAHPAPKMPCDATGKLVLATSLPSPKHEVAIASFPTAQRCNELPP